jgi:RNA polymerase-binding transcription factor DksA
MKEAGEIVRYSDAELAEFKDLILAKIEKAQSDLELIKSAYMNDLNNGTDDTSPTFKAFEEGSETMSKEANSQLAIRQEKFIRDLKNALIRIENKTYGMALLSGAVLLSGCMPAYRAAPEQAQVSTPSGWIGTSSEGTVVDSTTENVADSLENVADSVRATGDSIADSLKNVQ